MFVSSHLFWRLRTLSDGGPGGFSFDLARHQVPRDPTDTTGVGLATAVSAATASHCLTSYAVGLPCAIISLTARLGSWQAGDDARQTTQLPTWPAVMARCGITHTLGVISSAYGPYSRRRVDCSRR